MLTEQLTDVEFEFLQDGTSYPANQPNPPPQPAGANCSGTYIVSAVVPADYVLGNVTISGSSGWMGIGRVVSNSEVTLIVNARASDSMDSAPSVVRQIWRESALVAQGGSEPSKIGATLASLRVLCRNEDIDAAVDRCFEVIESAFARRDLASVDELLDGAEPNDLHPRVTIGMLRATSRARDKLQAWTSLLVKEQARLRRTGENDKRMLRGLLPVNANNTFASRTITA